MTTRTSPAPAGLLRPSLHCLAFAVALGSAGAALAKDVTWEDIANDDKTTGDVLQYGMGTHAQRWSPLKQVNADNVFKLTPAWSYSFGDEKQRGQESQAIVSDGVIYVTASYSRLFALDAKTGKRLWTYNHRLPDDIRPCCDVVNRGAAIYGDKVFFGTLDASVVALNKNTGKVVWKKKFADHGAGYTMTGAPTIVKDGKTGKVLLIHGSSGDEFGVVGRLFARDPDTGEEIWMRPFVEGHMGRLNGKDSTVTGDVKAPSWPDDRNSPTGKVESWSHGGGAPWQSASFDAETNTIIVGAGNPGPWNTWARTAKGGNPHDYDSLYTSGQVGVDPSSGEVKWFYQHTPNDAWDFSGNNELVLFDYKAKDGKIVKATAHADRNGFFYVVDRSNGKLQNAFPFVDNITWASHIDLKTGRPVEREGQRPPLPEPGQKHGKAVEVSPPFLGGKNWNPMAYSQDTGLFYVPANHWKEDYWTEEVSYTKGSAYLGMGFRIKRMYDDHVGSLRAMDPVSGKVVLGTQGTPAALGRGAGHRRQPGVHRHRRRLLQGLRREERQGAVEIPDRQRHRLATDHLGTGRRAVPRRDRRLRRRRAAVGRRHGRPDPAGGPGRFLLGIQAAQLGQPHRQPLIPAPRPARRGFPRLRSIPMKTFLLCAALLGAGLAQAADDIDDVRVIAGCRLEPGARCAKADLRGADLRNLDLGRIDLAGADLSGADLRHARLDLANLEKANLRGADLTRASLQQANLRGADLSGARAVAIQAWGLFAQGAQWQGADLTAAYLEFARLSGGRLHQATLRAADLEMTWLSRADLKGADLRDANLQEVKLAEANLEDADLRGSKVRFGNFQGSNMQGCKDCPAGWQ